MSIPKIRINQLPLLIAIAIIIGIFAGKYLYQGKGNTSNSTISVNNGKIEEIISKINSVYVDTVDAEELTDNTIDFLLDELDPHSSYVRKKNIQGEEDRMEGNFDGIGIQFQIFDDTIVVLDAVKGGPSMLAGIKRGDRVITVEGKNYTNKNLNSSTIKTKLRGKKGTVVNVRIWRPSVNDSLDFKITRGEIPIVSVDVGIMLTPKIGLIKVNRFARNTVREFQTKLEQLKELGLTKLILDLRGNPGGLLDQSILLSDQFLTDNKLVLFTRSRAGKQDYRSTASGDAMDIPLAILVDESSASASEIVSGALQDNDRAIIVGRRTFGKGLVQQQYSLGDGSAFRLTIARYYTPSGRCIQRHYEKGNTHAYYQEIAERYNSGELSNEDSIHFPDSLLFKTTKGRTVYGGGGITPDVFVPIDTNYSIKLMESLNKKHMLDRFALSYNLSNIDTNSVEVAYKQLIKSDLLLNFSNKISSLENYSKDAFDKSKSLISSILIGKILRGLYNEEGLYYPRLINNPSVISAIDNLDDQNP